MSKVILITGASSGMGKEAAKKLIQEGHTVYAVARRIDQMQDFRPAWSSRLPTPKSQAQRRACVF